jgi:tetratricopeptide (TPR) repeat protein
MSGEEVVRTSLAEGMELYAAGEVEQAFERFRQGHEADPGNAKLRSYYGLCLGLVERDFQQSAELCRSAARQEFFNPSLYLNLGRLHLTFGFKSEGVRYLQRGKMIDPGNVEIEHELAELGRRDPPIIQFLPRRHILNRWLGLVRHHMSQRAEARSLA